MMEMIRRLYPICRSITGAGLRQTLNIIGEQLTLDLTEVASGTQVFDWTIPPEWNLRRATLKAPDGSMLADTDVHNLHVVNYSLPIKARMTLAELQPHLHSSPEMPNAIPYRTSYYAPAWGFCLADSVRRGLAEGEYEVEIDSTLAPGALTYADYVLPGKCDEEFLISAHCCHPSLANDNLAGIAVAVELAKWLNKRRRKYTYRFIFAPGTIGSITWLSRNRDCANRVKHGLVLTCLGDPGAMTYKRSRRGDAQIDRVVEQTFAQSQRPMRINDFIPYGYDERQYCSPGFNLPVGVIMRTPNGQYPEYHTSADNLDLVRPEYLLDSLNAIKQIIQTIELNTKYINTHPHCEPQLGRRGLYSTTGGTTKPPGYEMALLWVLNYSDGQHDLLDIATRSKIPLETIAAAADVLVEKCLLRVADRH
ncbi:MAG: DUF4910 domain-containing protein [Burkholderiales bacterium]|nr:DUF4910 domain-containing protein [Phycisphaerae bacterium]